MTAGGIGVRNPNEVAARLFDIAEQTDNRAESLKSHKRGASAPSFILLALHDDAEFLRSVARAFEVVPIPAESPTLEEKQATPEGGPMVPWKLRDLAELVDSYYPADPRPVVQNDLRRWADEIESGALLLVRVPAKTSSRGDAVHAAPGVLAHAGRVASGRAAEPREGDQ